MHDHERLRKLRITLSLSADGMAAALGFTGGDRKNKIRKMELNTRDISASCLDKIAQMEREAGINPPKIERAGNGRA
jgi:hypothetical protein